MLFDLPSWKTRDQGSLIATVWQHNLQHHPTLSNKWNFIAGYLNPMLSYNNEGFFTNDNWSHKVKATLVHVLQHFGDSNWELWRQLNKWIDE
jgi:hypothetical protein